MIWEALGSAAIGLALALAATRRFPERLPDRRLVLATGPVAALVGGLITRIVLGSGHLPVALCVALGVSTALLSLLLRDAPERRQWRRDTLRTTPAPRSAPFAPEAGLRRQAPARPSASYGPR
ncbi:hypothetical protein ACH4LN_21715 [Streptomyces albus]|uniref:Uncharacterized protein n=1 Tax=Streptomyces albus TaxID=1888 RepID=A0A6C1C7Q5_9ACTN|nr:MULTISPECIES: hypothetical protein [Streptomyces]KPC92482.1 hypothetical protein ADL27_24740 [Streptomyces sp. NRRL F-6602]EPD94924.1 hypothetical protein HMPREF1486_02738 [Streptomyces sp. HPH0547]MDI6409120.1 hypothetical protein [Streptomyces albus]QID38081.1 hypothetical protein G3260_004646 [Streptomyces albus]TGG75490.1 hypothetical protein D8771_31160 [Streptomyces albus]